MHNEIRDFFARMRLGNGYAFNTSRVLECGAYDINGNPRAFFSSAKEYVGLDWRPGPGVDVVSLVHEYNGHANGHFGFVIATSLLEHDPHWKKSIARMVDLLEVGGSMIITCGGPGFHEHEIETAPAYDKPVEGGSREISEVVQAGVYYSNRTANEIVGELTKCARFLQINVEDDPGVHDIRVFAVAKMHPDSGFVAGLSGVKAASC